MRISEFEIGQDGETIVVYKVGYSEKNKTETFAPVAYVRDLKAGLEAVMRRMSANAVGQEKTIPKVLKLLKKQHEEVMKAIEGLKL